MVESLGYIFTPQLSEASTANLLNIIPTTLTIVAVEAPKPVFEPKIIEKNLVLEIDTEKSFFQIRKQPDDQRIYLSSPWRSNIGGTGDSYESKKYPISGKIELFDKYYDSESVRKLVTNITEINVNSGLSNIALDPRLFLGIFTICSR